LNKNQSELTAERLEREIDSIQQNLDYRIKQHTESVLQAEQALKKEVSIIQSKLQRNEEDNQTADILSQL
jgi:hypothetical protein